MNTEQKIEAEAEEFASKNFSNKSSFEYHSQYSSYIAGRSKGLEREKENAIGFAHWKDRHFKRTYPWTGYFYCLENYESVKLIPGVLYGEHYSFEQLYDMYIVSQK